MQFVLDTNVVIDWLVFDDPFMTPLRTRAIDGSIGIVSHELTIEELARVLRYPMLNLSEARSEEILRRYVDQTIKVRMPDGFARDAWSLPKGFPSCRDRDDDLFLALAFHSHASALVTRDKLLLKMRKRVRKFGVTILDVPQFIATIKEPATSAELIAGS